MMLFFAEFSKRKEVAFMAGLFMIILSFWILADGLQIRTGEAIVTNETTTENIATSISELADTNETNTTSTSITTGTHTTNATATAALTSTVTYNYADIPATPYFAYSDLIGLICLLMGIYICLWEAVAFFSHQY